MSIQQLVQLAEKVQEATSLNHLPLPTFTPISNFELVLRWDQLFHQSPEAPALSLFLEPSGGVSAKFHNLEMAEPEVPDRRYLAVSDPAPQAYWLLKLSNLPPVRSMVDLQRYFLSPSARLHWHISGGQIGPHEGHSILPAGGMRGGQTMDELRKALFKATEALHPSLAVKYRPRQETPFRGTRGVVMLTINGVAIAVTANPIDKLVRLEMASILQVLSTYGLNREQMVLRPFSLEHLPSVLQKISWLSPDNANLSAIRYIGASVEGHVLDKDPTRRLLG